MDDSDNSTQQTENAENTQPMAVQNTPPENNGSVDSTLIQQEEKKCPQCGKMEELSRCAGCKEAWYCSTQCQQMHWKVHKEECKKKQQILKEKAEQALKASRKSLDSFRDLKWVGQGNFSEIFSAVEISTGRVCAIKQINKRRVSQINKEKDVFMEKHCLGRLNENAYAVKIYSTFQDDDNLYFQMELVEGGELWKHIYICGAVSQSLIKYYMGQIVKAIHSFHQLGIVHRDIKSENILLKDDYSIKFIDFGTARDLQNPHIQGSGNGAKGKRNFQHFVGTPHFMAPECIRNRDSNEKSDVYSLGCLFYQLIYGNPPFEGGSEYLIFTQTLENQVPFPKGWIILDEQIDLIKKMLIKDLNERISLDEVMAHPYWNWDWNNLPTYQQAREQMTQIELQLEEVKYKLIPVDKIESREQQLQALAAIFEEARQVNQSEEYLNLLKYVELKSQKLLQEEKQPESEQFPTN